MANEQLRRMVPRQPVDWIGSYRFDSVSDEPWRNCRIIDLSPAGAGLELFEATPGERLDGLLTVTMELHGKSLYALPDEENRTARVGVQFPSLSEAAAEYIRSFDGTRW